MTNVCIYMEIVRKIVDDIKTENLNQIPCLINTMGFVEGTIRFNLNLIHLI